MIFWLSSVTGIWQSGIKVVTCFYKEICNNLKIFFFVSNFVIGISNFINVLFYFAISWLFLNLSSLLSAFIKSYSCINHTHKLIFVFFIFSSSTIKNSKLAIVTTEILNKCIGLYFRYIPSNLLLFYYKKIIIAFAATSCTSYFLIIIHLKPFLDLSYKL